MELSLEKMFAQAMNLPEEMPELQSKHSMPPTVEGKVKLSKKGKALVDAFKPMIEAAEVGSHMAGRSDISKQFVPTVELLLAQQLRTQLASSPSVWTREATLAGTDIPSYQRQIIAMIMRAFPAMFTLQLFPVTPFTGPDGRIYFKSVQYNSVFTGSPSIASGDLMSDLTKFNKSFAQVDQGGHAKKLKILIDSITATVSSYRLTSEWTYEAEDDMAALYGEVLESSLVREMTRLIAWTTDRVMIDAAVADVNSTQSWDSTASGLYSSFSPSEKKAYDETIWSNGILPLINSIQNKRVFTTYPTWFVVGTTLAQRIQKLTSFVPVANPQGNQIDMSTGSLRDVGTLSPIGIRVLVDPQLSVDTGLMGYRPSSTFEPAIHYAPYKPIRMTGTHEDPNIGTYETGAYSRFAVVRKNTGVATSSGQLGDPYGLLTVTS